MFKQHFISLTVIALSLTACGKSEDAAHAPASPTAASWMLTSAPEGEQSISQAKASAKEGDTIVLRGRIGGRAEPITGGSPVFTMMDSAIPHCAMNEDDNCQKPWDYCCETRDAITANSATVQVVNESGEPIIESLTGRGLAALDEVVIVGTVAPRPSESVLTVRATGVYRVVE